MGVGRHAPPYAHVDPQDLRRFLARHQRHRFAVEHAQRAGFPRLLGERLEVRPGQLRQVHRRKVRVSQVHHARGDGKVPAILRDIAVVLQSQQQPPRRGAGHVELLRHILHGEAPRAGGEQAQQCQAIGQRIQQLFLFLRVGQGRFGTVHGVRRRK